MSEFDRVTAAIAAIARGEMVLVADDADRENEGDLIMAAQSVLPSDMAFLLRHGSGIVCTPMSDAVADALDLPMMVASNTDTHHTAFTVSVDAVGTGTGISAADRAATVRALAWPDTTPEDLRRPGHVFPLRAKPGGTLQRNGHTEAGLDLVRLAGCREVAVITELVDDDGIAMSGTTLTAFALEHGLPLLTIAELVAYRRRAATDLSTGARIPTEHGVFTAQTYTGDDGVEHLVLSHGDVVSAAGSPEGVLVRVHSECLTGDVLGSRRCDCGPQLDAALAGIAAEGAGVLVYLRGHEGRGIGLGHKLAAYRLQQQGRDTVQANVDLGLPVDGRDYQACAQILHQLGINRIRLITNNPAKIAALAAEGLAVQRVRTPIAVTPDNITYLQTKRDRMGHLLDSLPAAVP